ncbi:uncharacterized protein TRAVEDRAFT_72951 [Trametes versicolor FP-101664 SS1]|uniref:uncharacterized protein n=1 Tax=Trametes versicolor (strain FP-101664) TaxID=717944 RepID=UPI000462498D|nr:uncharacterized protein TRAVEDRAFT_72951 [Trametes versicolor FP-101664 SS1]EIW56319.1 hypothetical protein TRAVEDRAFT_72951 [Trametes versicolor FP-101664 SS1]
MSNLNPTYGALFVGVLLSAVLFGVTMLQMFVYFHQYPTDRAWRKLAVGWLWLLDAIHLALSAHFVYFYLVTNFDKPDALSHIVWSFKLRIVIDSLVVCSVHTLYTSRLWTLLAIDERMEPFGKEARRWSRQKLTAHASASRWIMRRLVPWLVSGLVGLGYGIAIVMCVETFKLEAFSELAHTPWATYVPLGASTVIDGVIAGSLCYFLARCRPRSEAMNGPFKTLMVYTLNTGTITGLFSLLAISMMVAYPTTFIPVAIEFTVVKLYINSYMAMLNARGVIHPSQVHHTRTSFLPSNSRIFRYPLEQKGLPFASFSASVASLHLAQRPPNPSPTPGAHHAPTSDARASAEWTRPSPVPTLRAPRLSHPDVSPQYGGIETVVGVAFPAAALGQQQRFNSFTSASSSATVAVPPSPNPLAAVYATPVDPLSTAHPLPPTLHIEMAEITETTVDPPEYPSPPDRALSPLRFASYASSIPSPSGSLSSPSSPTHARHSRPRIPSAYSMDTRDGEERRTSLPSDSPGSERRYTRMVNAARESRRTLGSFQSGTGGVEDDRGVWVWGGPGSSSAG